MKVISRAPIWILFFLSVLSSFTENSCSSAMPEIAKSLAAPEALVQLSSTIYFFGFALGILSLGRVSDIFGRKPVVLFGIGLYIIASFLIIFVNNIEILFFLRFIQAFGASVGSVVGQAIARDSYNGKELSYVYASLSIGLAIVPSLGSVLSGYVIEYINNWRCIFLALSTCSVSLMVLYYKYLPETNPYIGTTKNNYLLVVKTVLSDKTLLLYAFTIGAFNGIGFGFYMEAPFIFINQIHMKPSTYGIITLSLSIASATGAIINKQLIQKHIDNQKIMASGLALSFMGCTLLLIGYLFFITTDTNKYLTTAMIFIPMMMHVMGGSFFIPLALRHSLEGYSKTTGAAGSIFGFLYYMIIVLISFIITELHKNQTMNFAFFFLLLSCLCSLSFQLIRRNYKARNETIG
ncbi:MAG: Bcr/CflA family efflux MFS transporter [Rickettsiaceae bacterium]|nr:MAG: Bcr/CflA family efflux MFS transporter [Rickettsiaceae bacterium]